MAPRLELLTGKGGVGKTTLAAALALEAAASGRRPLVVELGHRSSVAGVLGRAADVAHSPTDVGHGVHAASVDVGEAILGYAEAQLRVKALARAVTKNQALNAFLRAAPGAAEVATYHYLSALLDEREDGAPRWDPILVDLDATGHALMFLQLPEVLDGLIGTGPLRGLLESFSAHLGDPSMTALHLVSLPRALPVEETESLVDVITASRHVTLGHLFINRMPSEVLPVRLAPAAARLQELQAELKDERLRADLALLARARREEARALALATRLEALPLGSVRLPRVEGPITLEVLRELGALARRGVS